MVLYNSKILDVKRRPPMTTMPSVKLFKNLRSQENESLKKLDPEMMQDVIVGNIALDLEEVLKHDTKSTAGIPIIEMILENLKSIGVEYDDIQYIKSLAGLALHKLEHFSETDNFYYEDHFTMTYDLLGVDATTLKFLLDAFSGNPMKIFCTKTKNPKINLKTWASNIVFDDPVRMEWLTDLLDINKAELKRLAAAWIYSNNLMKQGQKSTFQLA